MPLSTADLLLIVQKASNLTERLSGDFVPTTENSDLAQRRLARWKTLSAGDDPEKFTKVLRAVGVGSAAESALLPLLGTARRKAEAPLPGWARFLSELVDGVAEQFSRETHGDERMKNGRRKASSLPFKELICAIGDFAWKQLESLNPPTASLSPPARANLQTYLLRRASSIVAVALHTLFLAHKANAQPDPVFFPFGMGAPGPAPTDPCKFYNSFVSKQGQEGLKTFFLQYPVAGRLLAQVTMDWVEFVNEFLRRLDGDQPDLALQFNKGQPLGEVVALRAGVSDPHYHGRTVIILCFKSRLRIVYKPRPMEVDQRFFSFVQAINATGRVSALRALEILDRGEYGWMEFAEHRACSDERAAERFYTRAGSLACLVQWLQGIDGHWTNFVAAGEQPVLIDLEALAHPILPQEGEASSSIQLPMPLASSPLRTGMLPYWQPLPNSGALYDNTALGAPTTEKSLVKMVDWTEVNTDEMQCGFVETFRKHRVHLPRICGSKLSVEGYARQTVAGYLQMADLLTSPDRNDLDGLWEQIQAAIRRKIKRSSLVYFVYLQRTSRPQFLVDGLDRSVELQALPHAPEDFLEWATELASLERLDVPYFRTSEPSLARKGQAAWGRSNRLPGLTSEILEASLKRNLILVEGKIQRLSEWRKAPDPDQQIS